MDNRTRYAVLVIMVLFIFTSAAHAQLKGAIFTTNSNGSEVNGNIYSSKDQVYLDGGPPPGAPQTAAGLPDGTYVFQVTDPSGKTLLSTDPANCRQFIVSNGIITGVVVTGCQHRTLPDNDHGAQGAVVVQLIPYSDTPNNGDEYKAWATPLSFYLATCDMQGVSDGLSAVDCGYSGGVFHGFDPGHSKTDNFKVRQSAANREIDTRFVDGNNNLLLNLGETWTNTLGVNNPKFSYIDAAINNPGLAHVELPEPGVHRIIIDNQIGCAVAGIDVGFGKTSVHYNGPASIDIRIKATQTGTVPITVYCQ